MRSIMLLTLQYEFKTMHNNSNYYLFISLTGSSTYIIQKYKIHIKHADIQKNHSLVDINQHSYLRTLYILCRTVARSWRCGSVVRTSVFGRRTFPDLYRFAESVN